MLEYWRWGGALTGGGTALLSRFKPGGGGRGGGRGVRGGVQNTSLTLSGGGGVHSRSGDGLAIVQSHFSYISSTS